MNTRSIFILGVILFLSATAFGQIIHVNLDLLTTEDRATSHLEPFMMKPPVHLTLPLVDTTNARFMVVFYTYGHGDPYIYIMVLTHSNGELLYIDRNYDHDLSNDGPPALFGKQANELTFDIVSRKDSLQTTRFLLLRNANMFEVPDSIIAQRVDTEGNLTPAFAQRAARLLQRPDFLGQRGTFYWDERVSLRRGMVNIGDRTYALGILDATNNGCFNDDSGNVKDLLIVDLHSIGKLRTYDGSNVFNLTDVIPFGNEKYAISSIDKYGRWVELTKTDEQLKFTFFQTTDSSAHDMSATSIIRQLVHDSLWNTSMTLIDGAAFSLTGLRGKTVLLNFWGEWCKPCLEEIPSLLTISENLDTTKFFMISFLQANDIQKAREVIQKNGVTWAQVMVTKELEEQCQIMAYPTNILIFPDGKNCIRKSSKIDTNFLAKYTQ